MEVIDETDINVNKKALYEHLKDVFHNITFYSGKKYDIYKPKNWERYIVETTEIERNIFKRWYSLPLLATIKINKSEEKYEIRTTKEFFDTILKTFLNEWEESERIDIREITVILTNDLKRVSVTEKHLTVNNAYA
jgi:hypothetical protein